MRFTPRIFKAFHLYFICSSFVKLHYSLYSSLLWNLLLNDFYHLMNNSFKKLPCSNYSLFLSDLNNSFKITIFVISLECCSLLICVFFSPSHFMGTSFEITLLFVLVTSASCCYLVISSFLFIFSALLLSIYSNTFPSSVPNYTFLFYFLPAYYFTFSNLFPLVRSSFACNAFFFFQFYFIFLFNFLPISYYTFFFF